MEQDPTTPAWRHLPFYEVAKVKDAADFALAPKIFRSPTNVTAVATVQLARQFTTDESKWSAKGSSSKDAGAVRHSYVLVGQSNGDVAVCEPEHYTVLGSWTAFHGAQGVRDGGGAQFGRVTHISADRFGRIVTLGEDHGARFPILRMWDLEARAHGSKKPILPRLLAEAKVQHGSQPFPIASLAVTSTSKFLAVGLGDGTVLLLRNLSETLSTASKKSDSFSATVAAVPLPKFKVVHQASSRPGDAGYMDTVTGLGFAEEQGGGKEQGSGATLKSERRRKDGLAGPAYKPRVRQGTQAEHSSDSQSVSLYIVTLTRTLRYAVAGKGAGSPISMVDDVGCALECAAIVSPSPLMESDERGHVENTADLCGNMVVAREDAIYVIGADGREMSLAYEGKKSAIRLMHTQLVIVSPPLDASAASNSATVRHYVAGRDRDARGNGSAGAGQRNTEVAKVTIFDLEGKFIAFSGTVENGVRNVWADAEGSIVVLSDDGKLLRIDEKPLRQKLGILFRKSLYLLTIGVARSHARRRKVGNVAAILADIHRRYGDSLYEKGDFEASIGQFVKTIGITQPSYVIRKFLDAQRITNLTTYLQELHERGFANADHTTLLLNCFAKLKDVSSLDRFIKRPIVQSGAANGRASVDEEDDGMIDKGEQGEGQDDLPFDLDTAIRVCRQGGYYEHAAYLALRYGQLDEYIRIQIEDMSDCKAARQHISGLSLADAERNLIRYGRKLLQDDADATTDLFVEICSGAFAPVPVATGTGIDAAKMVEGKAKYLDYLDPRKLQAQTQTGVKSAANDNEATIVETDRDDHRQLAQATPPNPRIFFSHYLGHARQFIRFLETVALARWDQKIEDRKPDASILPEIIVSDQQEDDDDTREQKVVWNTLFAILLSESKRNEVDAQLYRSRAISLLQQYDALPYDVDGALISCQQEDFTEGIVLLYERLGMYEDILRLHIERETRFDQAGDTEQGQVHGRQLLHALDRYGPLQQRLYAIVLGHVVSSERRLQRHRADVERVLAHIFNEALMSPLEVVQMLSKKGVATIGLVRDHLMRALDEQQSDIATNTSLTRTYRDETRNKQAEIEALRDVEQPRIFQQSRCSACAGMLDLPSIHFMCRHSFHSRCLAEAENECPLCAQSHGVILEIRRNNLQFGHRHDLFLDEVREADDGFDAVANMFSKGLFNAQQLGEER